MSGATKLMTPGGGGVVLTPASSIASDVTVNIPPVNGTLVNTGSTAQVSQTMLATGVAGNGPAFSAALTGSNQSVTSATWTAAAINTKTFDTATAFNNTGSTVTLNGISVPAYSFAPPVAGYYQLNGSIYEAGATISSVNIGFYKNGAIYRQGLSIPGIALSTICVMSDIVYLNGTSDYITLYGYVGGTGTVFAAATGTWFSGAMVRSA